MTEIIKVIKYKAVRVDGKFKIVKTTTKMTVNEVKEDVKEEIIIPVIDYCSHCGRSTYF